MVLPHVSSARRTLVGGPIAVDHKRNLAVAAVLVLQRDAGADGDLLPDDAEAAKEVVLALERTAKHSAGSACCANNALSRVMP
jgi:hypothetical protein